jgi:hypothetical protein
MPRFQTIRTAFCILLCVLAGADAVHAQTVVTAPSGRSGRLERGDAVSASSYYDEYRYEGRRNETVQVSMRSMDFDARLELRTAAGVLVAQNDDFGQSLNARISHQLPGNGWYVIRATSSRPSRTGAYTVGILSDRPLPRRDRNRVVPSPPPPPFVPMPQVLTGSNMMGNWEYTEEIGRQDSPYHCQHFGLLILVAGPEGTLSARFEQKGTCTIAGTRQSSAGEFSTTNVHIVREPSQNLLRLAIDRCLYTGVPQPYGGLSGTLQCTVRMPDGTDLAVEGTWRMFR